MDGAPTSLLAIYRPVGHRPALPELRDVLETARQEGHRRGGDE